MLPIREFFKNHIQLEKFNRLKPCKRFVVLSISLLPGIAGLPILGFIATPFIWKKLVNKFTEKASNQTDSINRTSLNIIQPKANIDQPSSKSKIVKVGTSAVGHDSKSKRPKRAKKEKDLAIFKKGVKREKFTDHPAQQKRSKAEWQKHSELEKFDSKSSARDEENEKRRSSSGQLAQQNTSSEDGEKHSELGKFDGEEVQDLANDEVNEKRRSSSGQLAQQNTSSEDGRRHSEREKLDGEEAQGSARDEVKEKRRSSSDKFAQQNTSSEDGEKHSELGKFDGEEVQDLANDEVNEKRRSSSGQLAQQNTSSEDGEKHSEPERLDCEEAQGLANDEVNEKRRSSSDKFAQQDTSSEDGRRHSEREKLDGEEAQGSARDKVKEKRLSSSGQPAQQNTSLEDGRKHFELEKLNSEEVQGLALPVDKNNNFIEQGLANTVKETHNNNCFDVIESPHFKYNLLTLQSREEQLKEIQSAGIAIYLSKDDFESINLSEEGDFVLLLADDGRTILSSFQNGQLKPNIQISNNDNLLERLQTENLWPPAKILADIQLLSNRIVEKDEKISLKCGQFLLRKTKSSDVRFKIEYKASNGNVYRKQVTFKISLDTKERIKKALFVMERKLKEGTLSAFPPLKPKQLNKTF